MTALVLELQKDAMDSSVALTDLLRKALVVAKKLNVVKFQEWIQNELNGYDDRETIPDYRKVKGEVKAWNPYHGYIPVIIQDEKLSEKIRTSKIGQPISELDSVIRDKEKGGILYIPFSQAVENMLMNGTGQLLRPTLHISRNRIDGILDAIRNTVLSWALKLEEEGILGKGLSFSAQEKEKAQANPNINIQNFQGILGNVRDSSVTQHLQMSVQMDNFQSLADFLKRNGVEEKDVSELQQAIEGDPRPETRNSLGEKVSGWIGKMISKAASGAWQKSVAVAGTLLTKAICAYYGLEG